MANDFYTKTGAPSTNSAGTSSTMRSEFGAIESGFDKLPTMTGNGNKAIFTNSGGTALETKTAAQARTLLDVYSKAEVDSAVTGAMPAGSVVAFIGGYFTNGSNGGFTNVIGDDAATINTLLNASGWYYGDGAAVNHASSSIYNDANRYLPNLTDDRFLMGDTAAGTTGGSSTHTHTTGDFTLTTSEIPSHYHSVNLNQFGSTGGADSILNVQKGDSVTTTINSGATGGGAAHNHGATGSTDGRPKFLACHYIVKVF